MDPNSASARYDQALANYERLHASYVEQLETRNQASQQEAARRQQAASDAARFQQISQQGVASLQQGYGLSAQEAQSVWDFSLGQQGQDADPQTWITVYRLNQALQQGASMPQALAALLQAYNGVPVQPAQMPAQQQPMPGQPMPGQPMPAQPVQQPYVQVPQGYQPQGYPAMPPQPMQPSPMMQPGAVAGFVPNLMPQPVAGQQPFVPQQPYAGIQVAGQVPAIPAGAGFPTLATGAGAAPAGPSLSEVDLIGRQMVALDRSTRVF